MNMSIVLSSSEHIRGHQDNQAYCARFWKNFPGDLLCVTLVYVLICISGTYKYSIKVYKNYESFIGVLAIQFLTAMSVVTAL
jgi:hypothetical protein